MECGNDTQDLLQSSPDMRCTLSSAEPRIGVSKENLSCTSGLEIDLSGEMSEVSQFVNFGLESDFFSLV